MPLSELVIVSGVILYVLSICIQRNDIADIGWGIGIVLTGVTSYFLHPDRGPLMDILLLLVTLWGVRLSTRIFLRNRRKGEDLRYKKWRDTWGAWFYVRSYLQIYLLQGFLMVVVGYPLIHVSVYTSDAKLGLITFLGIAIWCTGYFFEVIGDWQLDRFIQSKPAKGSILSTGLWKYSRHPNYFGEVTMWWGVWVMVAGVPMSYLALVSPLMITFLILKVSGIPLLERQFEGNVQFEEYKKHTSAFFPLPKC